MDLNVGAVDIFCGIGGLTNGIQKSGIKVIAGIDVDSSCEFAFTQNNNSIFINKSITEVKGKEVKNLLKAYDIKILIGCAPCQPFSNHQKDKINRKKHKDWNLLSEYGRVIREVKPHIVSMENVSQLQHEDVFNTFLSELKELKYHIDYKIVDASDYGVPQRRKRLILLASRLGKIELIKPTHEKNKVFVKDAISNLPPIAAGEKNKVDRLHYSSSLSSKNLLRIQASVPGGTWRDWPEELILSCHKAQTGKTYSSVYGRMKWDDVGPTITTQFTGYGTGRFGHPEQDRAITLREGAILQSFPPEYKFIPDTEDIAIKVLARHIGNAVPPRLGEIVGESILQNILKWKSRKKKREKVRK